MRKLMMTSAALLTILSPALITAPAFAQASTAETQVNSAAELSQLILNKKALELSFSAGFESEFRKGIMAEPASAALFGDNPQLIDLLINDLKPVLIDLMIADLPNAQSQLATLLANEMTQEQLTSSIAFLQTSFGQKAFQSGIETGVGFGTDSKETQNAIQALTEELSGNMPPEDMLVASRFLLSGASDKLVNITPKMTSLSKQWGKQISDDNQSLIVNRTITILQQYFSGK